MSEILENILTRVSLCQVEIDSNIDPNNFPASRKSYLVIICPQLAIKVDQKQN